MRYGVGGFLLFYCVACSGDDAAERGNTPEGGVNGGGADGGGVEKPLPCGDEANALPPAFVRRVDGAAVDSAIAITCTEGDAKELIASVLDEGIVRLRYSQETAGATAASSLERGSMVPLDRPHAATPARFGRRGSNAIVCTKDLEIAIDPKRCTIVATDVASHVVVLQDGERGGFYRRGASDVEVLRASPPSERIYGLGLHTAAKISSLDLRGSAIELYNTDAFDAVAGGFPPDAPHLYESIPFYIGLHDAIAYGVFTDETRRTKFDLAKTESDITRVTSFGAARVDQYLVPGPHIADVTRRYTRLTGRAPLPPPWAIGFHQSRWEGPCEGSPAERPFCSASQILDVAKRFRAEKIPADGIFLDIQHMNGFRTFTFDSARFGDPQKLIADLDALGFKTQIIVDPGIKIDPAWETYSAGLAGAHFLKKSDGSVFEGEVWPGPSVFPDFSADRTRTWWSGLAQGAATLGIRGLWIDMNEPASFIGGTVPDDVRVDGNGVGLSLSGGSTMAELHNAYALFEAKATYEGMKAARPDERPFVLSRAAFAGQQKWSAVWTGDAPSTWTTLGNTLPELLHLGMSGMTFAGSDVGGYSGRSESTAELFTRWMALGAISPFFRAHAEKDARRQEPWAFGPETRDAVRNLIRDRYALMPYLYSAFEETSRTGAPVLRPLVFEFQEDETAQTIADEAMLGGSLLVAPILTQAASLGRSVYLPKSAAVTEWFDLKSGAKVDAGTRITLSSGIATDGLPKDALPIFARAGAIVPFEGNRIDVFPPSTATKTSFVVYEDDGKAAPSFSRTTYSLTKTAQGLVFEGAHDGPRPPVPTTIRFRRIDHDPITVTTAFTRDANDRSISLVATAPFSVTITGDLKLEADGDVVVPVRILLPASTPMTTPIHIATSRNGWTHVPLARTGDEATANITMPRGAFTFFKITRGGWPTVEKGEGCIEIANRSIHGEAVPDAMRSTVDVRRWADTCP